MGAAAGGERNSKYQIDLRLGTQAARIDPRTREVALAGGGSISYDRLLLATGAEPVRPTKHGHCSNNRTIPAAIVFLAASAAR